MEYMYECRLRHATFTETKLAIQIACCKHVLSLLCINYELPITACLRVGSLVRGQQQAENSARGKSFLASESLPGSFARVQKQQAPSELVKSPDKDHREHDCVEDSHTGARSTCPTAWCDASVLFTRGIYTKTTINTDRFILQIATS